MFILFFNVISSGDTFVDSIHPPHILNDQNEESPSAFIPFCAFKSVLGIGETKVKVPGISFPICDQFRPVTLNGQLCYHLGLNKTGGSGEENGLMLMIDLNSERNIQGTKQMSNEIDFSTISFNKIKKNNKNAARLYIHTLSPFEGRGKGHYKMTSLKKMSGTSDFLGMTEVERKCQLDLLETCRLEAFYAAGEACQCVPWELPNPYKVVQLKSLCV